MNCITFGSCFGLIKSNCCVQFAAIYFVYQVESTCVFRHCVWILDCLIVLYVFSPSRELNHRLWFGFRHTKIEAKTIDLVWCQFGDARSMTYQWSLTRVDIVKQANCSLNFSIWAELTLKMKTKDFGHKGKRENFLYIACLVQFRWKFVRRHIRLRIIARLRQLVCFNIRFNRC